MKPTTAAEPAGATSARGTLELELDAVLEDLRLSRQRREQCAAELARARAAEETAQRDLEEKQDKAEEAPPFLILFVLKLSISFANLFLYPLLSFSVGEAGQSRGGPV